MLRPVPIRSLSGFTLIELLVVTTVMAVMIALLLPAMARVKEQGRRSLCLSNHHQAIVGLTAYSEGNRGRFPTGVRDAGVLAGGPLLDAWARQVGQATYDSMLVWAGRGRVLMCPGVSGGGPSKDTAGNQGWLLGYNYLGGHQPPPATAPNGTWNSPRRNSDNGQWPIWTDITGRYDEPSSAWASLGPHGANGITRANAILDPNQYGVEGTNVGYLDGSARWRSIRDVTRYQIFYNIPVSGAANFWYAFNFYGYW